MFAVAEVDQFFRILSFFLNAIEVCVAMETSPVWAFYIHFRRKRTRQKYDLLEEKNNFFLPESFPHPWRVTHRVSFFCLLHLPLIFLFFSRPCQLIVSIGGRIEIGENLLLTRQCFIPCWRLLRISLPETFALLFSNTISRLIFLNVL